MLTPSSSWRSISSLDSALCVRINRVSRIRAACLLFRGVSRIGDGVVWYVLMIVLLLLDGANAWPVVLRMVAAGAIGIVIYKALKVRTSRPRPYRVVPAVTAAAAPLDEFSFPSGHTLHAVSMTLIATANYPALSPALFPLAILIGVSRPILGLHYPTDVLAGAAIGAAIAYGMLLL